MNREKMARERCKSFKKTKAYKDWKSDQKEIKELHKKWNYEEE